MKPKVFILATCRKKELLPYTTMVFNTLRVGFPDNEISVHYNGIEASDEMKAVSRAATIADVDHFFSMAETIHHKWIEFLCGAVNEPFWICDTDVMFYDRIDEPEQGTFLKGYRIPEYFDEVTGSVARARLHSSLLYIDPLECKSRWEAFKSRRLSSVFTPMANPFHPAVYPVKGRTYFNDTCSVLYNAIGGTAFLDREKDKYFHFHAGTIFDIVQPGWDQRTAAAIEARRLVILHNPVLGVGAWREQDEFYANRQP